LYLLDTPLYLLDTPLYLQTFFNMKLQNLHWLHIFPNWTVRISVSLTDIWDKGVIRWTESGSLLEHFHSRFLSEFVFSERVDSYHYFVIAFWK
jgi:hypothetical protein